MSEELKPNNPYEPFNSHDEEMRRIQEEIFKALQAAQKPQPPTYQQSAEEKADGGASGQLESIERHAVVEPLYPEGERKSGDGACYQENIKNSVGKPEKSGHKRLVAAAIVLCLLGGSVGGYFIGASRGSMGGAVAAGAQAEKNAGSETKGDEGAKPAASTAEAKPSFAFEDAAQSEKKTGADVPDLRNMSDQFVSIIQKVEPSVVAITSSEVYSENFLNEEIERDTGSASGIIFAEDDEKVYIVTNQHVINAASRVYVSVEGSDTVPAKHVGSDSNVDMAVISILKSDLKKAGVDSVTVAAFGDSEKLQVGEIVLAIGNAFGQGNSSTMGLISAPEKEIRVSPQDPPLHVIQTSATINFGNSGGPLVNLNGEVIGINTAKISPQYGAESTGYAITSNRAKPIIEGFMNRTNRAFLGVSGATITPEISQMYGLPEAGVFVNGVISGTAAEKAGILRTDIITSVNGDAIFTVEQLTETIQSLKVGDSIKIGIIREGKTPMTIIAQLEQYSDTSFGD